MLLQARQNFRDAFEPARRARALWRRRRCSSVRDTISRDAHDERRQYSPLVVLARSKSRRNARLAISL